MANILALPNCVVVCVCVDNRKALLLLTSWHSFVVVQGDRFCDVDFRQLVKEPCKVVKDIYAHFGYDFSPEFEQRIEAYMSKCDPAQSLFCFICGPNAS